MNFEKCKICGEYGWESHKCAKKWYVITKDEYEEYKQGLYTIGEFDTYFGPVYADNSKEAAEKWAHQYDPERDYFIASGNTEKVGVVTKIFGVNHDLIELDWYEISAETVPVYMAVALEESDA